jgi:hypothetical protein
MTEGLRIIDIFISKLMAAPVLEGFARRWFFKHLAISSVISLVAAEFWWRGYELPRLATRDKYYRDMGVEWVRIVE